MVLTRVFIIEDLFTHRIILNKSIQNIFLPNFSFDVFPIENYIHFYDEIDSLTILDNDIFIIDIDLNYLYNGIDYAKKIREKNFNCFIIFLTADDQQGINIINQHIHATSYLVKEIFDIEIIKQTLEKEFLSIQETLNNIYIDHNEDYLFVQSNGSNFNIKITTILYIETIKTMKGYLHLKTLSQDLIIKSTISELKEQLKNSSFLVTNLRSLIVNLRAIESITPSQGEVAFINGTQLFAGRKTIKKIREQINSSLIFKT